MTGPLDQSAYDIRVDWGADGLAALRETSDVLVIVDVLSFSTCVDVVVGRGAVVFPFAERGEAALAFARSVSAACAAPRGSARFSLSPGSFESIEAGERVVLPSPNGGALSAQAGGVPTLTGCLRNAGAVARAASRIGRRVSIVAAGERWASGGLRPALEDLLGAGAIVAALGGRASPEAMAAQAAFVAARPHLEAALLECASGRELVHQGYPGDVAMAAALDVSRTAPTLRDGAFASDS